MIERSEWRVGPLGRRHRTPELHDHALHLCVNAFKDRLVLGHRWVREDLLRIARLPGFSPEVMSTRASEARLETLVWVVADWLADDGAGWRRLTSLLRPPRPRYAFAYRRLVHRSPASPIMSVMARAASDSALGQAKALGLGLVGTIAQATRGLRELGNLARSVEWRAAHRHL
jgi:hypothetical protein